MKDCMNYTVCNFKGMPFPCQGRRDGVMPTDRIRCYVFFIIVPKNNVFLPIRDEKKVRYEGTKRFFLNHAYPPPRKKKDTVHLSH